MNANNEYWFVSLKAITRRANGKQTLEFVQRVDDWMKQWTIENNFQPIITTDIDSALKQFAVKFEYDFASACGRNCLPAGLSFFEHFKFDYTKSRVMIDTPFYLNSGTWSVNIETLFTTDAFLLHGKQVNHG